jgi:molybdopterin converting factor small subunit
MTSRNERSRSLFETLNRSVDREVRWHPAAAAGVASVVFALAWMATPVPLMLDDGYITLHSASVLVTEIDHVFGEPALTGSTSPPHVALVAAALATGLPPLFALHLVTALTALEVRQPGRLEQLDDSVFSFAVNGEMLLHHAQERLLSDRDEVEIIPTISGG